MKLRLRILALLQGPDLCAGDISAVLGVWSARLYPALMKMEEAGDVESYWGEGRKPRRRLYKLPWKSATDKPTSYARLAGELQGEISHARVMISLSAGIGDKGDAKLPELMRYFIDNQIDLYQKELPGRIPAESCELLIECRDIFRHYEALHAAKPDMEKAKRNADMAEKIEALVGKKPGGAA